MPDGAALWAAGGQRWQADALAEGEHGERHGNRVWRSAAGTWLVAAEGDQVLRSAEPAARGRHRVAGRR